MTTNHPIARSPKRGSFEHINRTYGLNLTKNCAVIDTKSRRRGQVVRPVPGQEHYIEISWDGAPKPHGPYHPTEGLEYPASALQVPQSVPGEGCTTRESAAAPCPDCEAVGACCAAAKDRLATADSLARLTERQSGLLAFQGTQLAEILAAAPDLENIRVWHCLTEAGIKTISIGAPGSVAREAQEDVANLVNALWRIHRIAGRKQP